ncbi:MAG TPA: 50S ribosomal protein L11 methyltransferase [Cellvibrionaceae bacterium]|nr:50S ribosomal protein L11 methyltransferase [Cellvibrionaceae bacterium]
MPWLELRIDTDRDAAPRWEKALLKAGALSVTLQDNADQPIFEPALGETPLWQATRVTGLFDSEVDTAKLERQMQLPVDAFWQWQLLEDKDWEREWMKDFHPIPVAEHFWICPSWITPPEPDAVNLLLDPGLAFGTGTHPTTFMCLEWLSRQTLAGRTCIDYGCGSGILGIGALLLGATSVLGVDIDPQALIATQDNAQRNGLLPERFPVVFPKACPPTPVDVLLANILAGPLVELAPELTPRVKPGGLLCLSGILHSQAQAVVDAYSAAFDFAPWCTRDEWVCLSATKR